MTAKDPRRSLAIPLGPAARRALRAAAPRPEALAATARRLIGAALAAGDALPHATLEPAAPIRVQLSISERRALSRLAASRGLSEPDAARMLLLARLAVPTHVEGAGDRP